MNNEKTMKKLRTIKIKFQSETDLTNLSNKFKSLYDKDLNVNLKQVIIENEIVELFYKKSRQKPKEIKKMEWEYHWQNMPTFYTHKDDIIQIEFTFDELWTVERLTDFFEQKITDKTKTLFYPEKELLDDKCLRAYCDKGNPEYPIYVISKGRSENCITADYLIKMEVPFRIVIEKQEWDLYAKHYDENLLLELDLSFKEDYDTYIENFDNSKSKGSGPARNFVWWHSKNIIKSEYHWIIDDNIFGFLYFNFHKRILSVDGTIFKTAEDFIKRYNNIGIAGFDYYTFAIPNVKKTAYIPNTKIYSCILINNDIPIRWAGRYNEDVDLCIRAMKEGYSTIQFEAFVADKGATQTLGGGNTEAFYSEEGTLPKSNMLTWKHPDISNVTWKFGRWHHVCNYDIFDFYKDRTIKDTLIELNKPQLVNPDIDKDIINEIKNINFSNIKKWNILKFVPEERRNNIIKTLKFYTYLNDNNLIIDIITRPQILNCDLTNYLWGIEVDDKEDNVIMKKLLELPTRDGVLINDIDWDSYLDFVPETKRNLIKKEIIRNKYFRNETELSEKNDYEIFLLPREEHLLKQDSKARILNDYVKDGLNHKVPDTLLDKKIRGEYVLEKKKVVSNLVFRDTTIKKETDKHSLLIVSDKDYTDDEHFYTVLDDFIKTYKPDEIINSVYYPIDLISANYCLERKIPNKVFVPDFHKNGDGAYIEMYSKMSEYADETIVFVESALDKNLNYLIENIKNQNKKLHIHSSKNKIID